MKNFSQKKTFEFYILIINYIKNNPNKYVYSKYGFLLFKADWINIQIITIFKFISIYFIILKVN